jgi:hypothetical protein
MRANAIRNLKACATMAAAMLLPFPMGLQGPAVAALRPINGGASFGLQPRFERETVKKMASGGNSKKSLAGRLGGVRASAGAGYFWR